MKNLPLIDPEEPRPTDEGLRATVERARHLQRRRWLASTGTVLVLLMGIVGYAALYDGDADDEVSTNRGASSVEGSVSAAPESPPASASSPTASSTPVTSAPPTTQEPPPTTGETANPPFSLDLPPSWILIPGELYFNLPEDPPYRSLTAATYSFEATPSNRCVLPVAAIDALGPADAFVSITTGAPSSAFSNPRPSVSEMIPESGLSEEVKILCQLEGANVRYRESGFKENGRQYTIHVGLGAEADDARKSEVRRVLESIVIG